MTIPHDPELMPGRCRSAAQRAGKQANYADLTAFFKTLTGEPAPAVMIETFDIAGSPEQRKARADQIAQQMGATTEWWNGYYMATTTVGGLPVEIHFNPPIFASNMASGERREDT